MALAASKEASCGLLKCTWVFALLETLFWLPRPEKGPAPPLLFASWEFPHSRIAVLIWLFMCSLHTSSDFESKLRRQGQSLPHYYIPNILPGDRGHLINIYWQLSICHPPASMHERKSISRVIHSLHTERNPEYDLLTLRFFFLISHKTKPSHLNFFFFERWRNSCSYYSKWVNILIIVLSWEITQITTIFNLLKKVGCLWISDLIT